MGTIGLLLLALILLGWLALVVGLLVIVTKTIKLLNNDNDEQI